MDGPVQRDLAPGSRFEGQADSDFATVEITEIVNFKLCYIIYGDFLLL